MKDEEFRKLNKKQKLSIPYEDYNSEITGISRALFIPLRKKQDGYTMCAFFVQKDDTWLRLPDYDCFGFGNDIELLRGDFENHGVQFFLKGKYGASYGGTFRKLSAKE